MNETEEKFPVVSPENLEQVAAAIYNDMEEVFSKQKNLKKKVVDALPETGEEDIIYLIPNTLSDDQNQKLEYMWVDGRWELMGPSSMEVDLENYQKIPEDGSRLLSSQTEAQVDQTYNDHVEVYLDAKGINEYGVSVAETSNGADIVGATHEHAGVMTAADKVKLDGMVPMTSEEVTKLIKRAKGEIE